MKNNKKKKFRVYVCEGTDDWVCYSYDSVVVEAKNEKEAIKKARWAGLSPKNTDLLQVVELEGKTPVGISVTFEPKDWMPLFY